MRTALESGDNYANGDNYVNGDNYATTMRIFLAIPIAQASEDHLDRCTSSQGREGRRNQSKQTFIKGSSGPSSHSSSSSSKLDSSSRSISPKSETKK